MHRGRDGRPWPPGGHVRQRRRRDLIRVGDRDGWVCGICRDPPGQCIVLSDP
jgi:hypothetical protein